MQLPNPLKSKRSKFVARLTAMTLFIDEISGVAPQSLTFGLFIAKSTTLPKPPRPLLAALLIALTTTTVAGVPIV